MIYYFDTSAFVPLLITEPGSPRAGAVWDKAEVVISSRLLYIEASAALAQARRLGRIDERTHAAARTDLDDYDNVMLSVGLDDPLVHRAAEIATNFDLRGYDAVHCASAERLAPDGVVMVSGDKRRLRTCEQLGLGISNTNPS